MRIRVLLVVVAACGVNQTPQPAPGPALPSCIPNRDGSIDASELPIAFGVTLAYYTGTNRTVDLSGTNGVFDLSAERADDTVVALGPVAIATQWYADQFPAGQFIVDAGAGLDGIYHQDAQALWLDGTASQQMMPAAGKTLVRYAEPIALLRFPLHDGETYSTTAALDTATTIDGLPFVGTDRVDVDVTAGARLDVPYVEFSPILRVRTHVTRTPSTGTPVIAKRTTIFLFECFGEVARAESKQDEAAADFTSAAYLRRFALGQRGDAP
jgi:hypothetical protein